VYITVLFVDVADSATQRDTSDRDNHEEASVIDLVTQVPII